MKMSLLMTLLKTLQVPIEIRKQEKRRKAGDRAEIGNKQCGEGRGVEFHRFGLSKSFAAVEGDQGNGQIA